MPPTAAQPAKKERKPCGLDDRTACLERRFAAWPLSRFPMSGFSAQVSSNVWTPSSNAVSLRSLISTPTMFQVPFSPGSVRLHPSKAVTSNLAPKNRRAIRPECAPTVQTSRPFAFSAARPAGRSSCSRARHRSGWRKLAVAGVAPSALRGLFFQSPNTIYQSDPFCPSLRQQRPSEAKRACFSVPGQNTGRPLCYAGKRARLPLANARCLWPSTERALRLFRGGAGFALQRPPTGPLRAGRPPRRCPARWQPGTAPAKLSRCLLA